jgi:hypothetical protein
MYFHDVTVVTSDKKRDDPPVVPSSHATLPWMKMDEAMDEAIERKSMAQFDYGFVLELENRYFP